MNPPTLNDISQYQISPTVWGNIPYGPKSWKEVTLNNKMLYQVFDIRIPEGTPPPDGWPIMFYYHPNGLSKFIKAGSFIDLKVVQPCLKAGIAVVSVEFRHPVTNKAVLGDAYLEAYNDPGLAIQAAKSLHVALNLDINRIGIVAKSRGSLALFANLLPDLANSSAITYAGTLSSRATHVWINKGQSIHQTEPAAQLFVVPEDYDQFIDAMPPNDPLLLNQIDLVQTPDASVPKLHLVSQYEYYVDKQPAAIVLDNPLHYPDMMRVLAEAYRTTEFAPLVSESTNIRDSAAFTGLTTWFLT